MESLLQFEHLKEKMGVIDIILKDASNTEDDNTEIVMKCLYCTSSGDYHQVDSLYEHMVTEHKDKEFKLQCPKCQAVFSSKTQMEKHIAIHIPTSQICKTCNKTFANVYRLQRHMISHNESSDLRRFKCPECGKAFKFKHHLKEHIRIHSGEKPFGCSNCGKRFSHSGSYSSHMTSKKCWVVNMKMPQKGTEKSPEKRSDILRPLVLPYGDNSIAQLYANNAQLAQYAAATSQASHLMGQLNGAQQFLPYASYSVGSILNPLANPIMPSGPMFPATSVANLVSSQSNNQTDQKTEEKTAAPSDEKTQNMDENKNLQNQIKKETNNNADEEVKNDNGEADEAVKKVLEIVDATVSHQKQTADDKASISKLASKIAGKILQQTLQKERAKAQEASGGESCNNSTVMKCKYCTKTFQSPVDLHQHERYLCKMNTDIPNQVQPEQMKLQLRKGAESPASMCTDKTGSDEEVEGADENMPITTNFKPYRARSMFTDDQLQVLKAQYSTNPRPSKYDLQRIADEIGYPKRTVRVWFQNKRAQDRRKAKEAATSMALLSQTVNAERASLENANKSPYIPVVPHISMNGGSGPTSPNMMQFAHTGRQMNSRLVSGVVPSVYASKPHTPANLAYTMHMDEPLDLSTKLKSPPIQAHSQKPFSNVSPSPVKEEKGEVLDLSVKPSEKEDHSTEPNFKDSPIFKYMQLMQKDGEKNDKETNGRHSNCSTPQLMMARSRENTPVPLGSNMTSPGSNQSARSTPERPRSQGILMTSTPSRASAPPDLMPSMNQLNAGSPLPPGSPSAESLDLTSQSSLNSSFNSTHSLEAGYDGSLNGLYNKPKRARKKTWRQMEYEEEMELDDDNLIIDEDNPHRKKRRSWKHHKVETEETGMYMCDQCDKMFSKQSSLARHKYEHSGARPFQCNICSKAFKHKHHLTEHQRLHSGEKPFECQKCGKRFSHSGSFSQHMNHRYKYCKPMRLEMERQQTGSCVA